MLPKKALIFIVAIAISIMGSASVLQSQSPAGDLIDITGVVQALDATTIVVSGLQVDLSGLGDNLAASIEVGTTITVSGIIQNSIMIASTVVIATPLNEEAVEEPQPISEPTIGPVVVEEPQQTSPPINGGDDIVVIEGPVDAIGVNIITVFGIDIQVDPNNPIWTQIQVGQVVRVEGIGNMEGDSLVVVSVSITIVTVVIVNTGGSGGNPPPQPPAVGFNKDACKKGGWQNLSRADGSGFKNQGDCIQYVNTGK